MPIRPIVHSLAASLVCLAGGRAQSIPPAPIAACDDAATGVLTLQRSVAAIAVKCNPFVVTVTAHLKGQPAASETPSPSSAGNWVRRAAADDLPGYRPLRSCSGFVVDASGEILTCRSFLLKPDGELADVVTAETKDGRTTICDVIATEPTLNLALLRLAVYPEGCPPSFGVSRFADSTSVRPGHLVFALGDPSGPEVFFATGIISSLPSRECYQEQITATYLQTTMLLHPEAVGGPLLDLDGDVIGMLVPRAPAGVELGDARPTGIEFALPSNIITTIHHALAAKKSTRSPWLGFAIMSRVELRKERGPEAFDALRKPGFGVWIENTFDPSPAQQAGIRAGDFLVKLDGRPVVDPATFQQLLYLAGVGTEVTLDLFRDGQTFARKVTVAARPPEALTR